MGREDNDTDKQETSLQASVVQAFLDGRVTGLAEKWEKPVHLKTQLSNVFLFPATAYKLYRSDNATFNRQFVDLADPKTRINFYVDDFRMNHYFNTEVYRALRGIHIKENALEIAHSEHGADDFVIEMKRIDASKNLTTLLKNGQVTEEDCYTIGYQLSKMVATYPHRPAVRLRYDEIARILLDDGEQYAKEAEPVVPQELTSFVMAWLRSFADFHREEFASLTSQGLVNAIDNQSDNVFYRDGQTSILDAMPPKPEWRIAEPLYGIGRLSVDMAVLVGPRFARQAVTGYQDYWKKPIDEKKLLFYQVYAALLKGAICVIQGGETRYDETVKYIQFLQTNTPLLYA